MKERASKVVAVWILSCGHAVAACQSAAGNWTYTYIEYPDGPWQSISVYTFNLTQQSNGVLSGSGTTSFCVPENTFHSGTFEGNGHFSIHTSTTATNCQGGSWTLELIKPGCHLAAGTWRNDDGIGEGWGVWEKPCDIPNGELSSPSPEGWTPEGTTFRWTATLSPASKNFGGRTISENVTVSDNCWFSGSAVSMQTGTQGNLADVNTNNQFDDVVGWLPFAVTYYRNAGRAPCGFSATQTMYIDCDYGDSSYIVNGLFGVIGLTTVSSSRQGQTQTRTWL